MTVFFIQEGQHGPVRFSLSPAAEEGEKVVYEVHGGSGVLRELQRRLKGLEMPMRPGWFFTPQTRAAVARWEKPAKSTASKVQPHPVFTPSQLQLLEGSP